MLECLREGIFAGQDSYHIEGDTLGVTAGIIDY